MLERKGVILIAIGKIRLIKEADKMGKRDPGTNIEQNEAWLMRYRSVGI
jgi:hypothetical protein